MRYRNLGGSGIPASVVGLGTYLAGSGINDKEYVTAIKKALDRGVTLIDTAPSYGWGHSEEVVGKAIKGRRDDVIVATKFGLWWQDERGSPIGKKDGKDVRFDKAKQHFFWFLQFWMGQALWVSLTACAAVIAILSPEQDTLSTFVIVGASIWWFGFIYESIADYQKRAFRKSHDPHTEFINTGLWSRSRHPNYF